jgi:alpha-L-glutamate ligase-like protein
MRTRNSYIEWLRRHCILCMNRRNAEFIAPFNARPHYCWVDEKLRTKELAREAGVPCPETYGVIRYWHGIDTMLRASFERHDAFVIKPNRGAAGRGILIIQREGSGWRNSRGVPLSYGDVRYHVTSILSGLYSLSELPDRAIIEQRILPHALMRDLTWGGTPDLRIILFRTVPVIAMLRLPTKRSDGRANLHQGAAGLGVSIVDGVTRGAVCNGRRINHHPDTRARLDGLQLPAWERIITMSRRLAGCIPLGYIGIDIMLDAVLGPLVIEANARPGLGIQIANAVGLRPRLEFLRAELARGAAPDALWPELRARAARGEL